MSFLRSVTEAASRPFSVALARSSWSEAVGAVFEVGI